MLFSSSHDAHSASYLILNFSDPLFLYIDRTLWIYNQILSIVCGLSLSGYSCERDIMCEISMVLEGVATEVLEGLAGGLISTSI